MGGERNHREPDYRLARIAAALALVAVLSLLLFIDALSPEYDMSQVTFVGLLATIMGLLGADAVRAVVKRNGNGNGH